MKTFVVSHVQLKCEERKKKMIAMTNILIIGFFIIFVWLAYGLCVKPLNRIRLLEDNVGFAHVKGKARKKAAEIQRLRKMRQKGCIPPSFPNGWYALAESNEVRVFIHFQNLCNWFLCSVKKKVTSGDVFHVAALGENFALFRGEASGQAFVKSAYCPVITL